MLLGNYTGHGKPNSNRFFRRSNEGKLQLVINVALSPVQARMLGSKMFFFLKKFSVV